MNEKLEKEIDSYIATHFSEAYDGTLLSDATKAELSITDVAPMARYFYNLALQDVRQKLSYWADFFHGRGMGCDNAIEEKMNNIIHFIDNLTK